jgi:hypothetical protein
MSISIFPNTVLRRYPKLPSFLAPSYTFEAKAQPISLAGRSPARVWLNVEDDLKIWIEVRCTKLVQLGVVEMFEPVTPLFIERRYSGGNLQQDSAILTPDALRRAQVFDCEIPNSVTDVQRILCVVYSIASCVRGHIR